MLASYASSFLRLKQDWLRGILMLSIWSLILPAHTSYSQQRQNVERPRRILPAVGEPEDILRIDTDLILVDVTVTDASRKPVRGLQPQDFKLYEDNTERPVAFFTVEKKRDSLRPLAVVFALDTSGSMSPEEMERLRVAVAGITGELSARPCTFAALSFGMTVKRLQRFSGDRQKLSHAFDRLEREPQGLSTHLYDAVDDAIRLLVRTAPRSQNQTLVKRAVIVISDGFPVGDVVSPDTVIERANAAEVNIYTVTLPSYARWLPSTRLQPLPTPLDVSGLAEKTGGRNVYLISDDYQTLIRALAEDVSSSYVLAFYPQEDKRRDGQFHAIRVEVPGGLFVSQNRPGYVGNTR